MSYFKVNFRYWAIVHMYISVSNQLPRIGEEMLNRMGNPEDESIINAWLDGDRLYNKVSRKLFLFLQFGFISYRPWESFLRSGSTLPVLKKYEITSLRFMNDSNEGRCHYQSCESWSTVAFCWDVVEICAYLFNIWSIIGQDLVEICWDSVTDF